VSARRGTASAEEFLAFTADMNRKKGLAAQYVTNPEPMKIGGRILWKAYFNQRSNVMWRAVNIATVEKKHVLQFILMSPDEDGLRSLESLVRTLRFTD